MQIFAPNAESHPILGKLLQPNPNPSNPLNLELSHSHWCVTPSALGQWQGARSSPWEWMSLISPAEMTFEMQIISNMQMSSSLLPV